MQVWSTGMEPRLEVEIWESVVGQYIQELWGFMRLPTECAHGKKH